MDMLIIPDPSSAPVPPVAPGGEDALLAGTRPEDESRYMQSKYTAADLANFGRSMSPQPPEPTLPAGPLKLGPQYPTYRYYVNSLSAGTIASGTSCPLEASLDADLRSEQGLRLGMRRFRAIANYVNQEHLNVLRLELQPSTGQHIAQKLAGCLPRILRAWLFSLFPEWNLPPRMTLKSQKIPWYDEFDLEKATYARLRPLQGTVIPQLLGEVSYRGNRALLLSDLGGASPTDPEGCLMEVADFGRALRQCVAALSKFGVVQDDMKVDNFHVVGDKVMALDFEMVSDMKRIAGHITEEEHESITGHHVESLKEQYKENQYSFWRTGLIAVDGK